MAEDSHQERRFAQAKLEQASTKLAAEACATDADSLLLQDRPHRRADRSAIGGGNVVPQPFEHRLAAVLILVKLELESRSCHDVKGYPPPRLGSWLGPRVAGSNRTPTAFATRRGARMDREARKVVTGVGGCDCKVRTCLAVTNRKVPLQSTASDARPQLKSTSRLRLADALLPSGCCTSCCKAVN